MRYLYTFLFYLALPFIFLRLWHRSWRLPAYKRGLMQRLGFYSFTLPECIWVHAVSVGETIAAIPLVKALQQQYPTLPILMTTMTPTGAERVKNGLGDSVQHAYLSYDLPNAVQRFLKAMNPKVAIIMETELWPNLLHACHEKNISVCLLNARLSGKSARGYQRIASLTKSMLQNISLIAAHGKKDAERFLALGALPESVIVSGNIKFDLQLTQELLAKKTELRAELGSKRFIWIAASTHEGEETIILDAHRELCKQVPDALLILVPRHPDRFDEIAKLCLQNFVIARRSAKQVCTPETSVYLGDTMGELLLLYGAADVAFVGGSLIPRGGHNLLEPAALGMPILMGPHRFNFAEICQLFAAEQALVMVNDAAELARVLGDFARDNVAREKMGQKAKFVMDSNRGALDKQLQALNKIISI